MSTVRYSMKVVKRARELYAAGWKPPRISGFLRREFGVGPSPQTIRLWCSKPATEETRRAERARRRREWRTKNPRRVHSRLSDDWKLERMVELRDRGLSFTAISHVADVWWGESLTEAQVRGRLAGKRKYDRRKAVA